MRTLSKTDCMQKPESTDKGLKQVDSSNSGERFDV
jgi:hypothetical protein